MRYLVVRRCEPEDYRAVHVVYSSPQAMAETLGVPYFSEQAWREVLARERDDDFAVVTCVQGEVVGHLALDDFLAAVDLYPVNTDVCALVDDV